MVVWVGGVVCSAKSDRPHVIFFEKQRRGFAELKIQRGVMITHYNGWLTYLEFRW